MSSLSLSDHNYVYLLMITYLLNNLKILILAKNRLNDILFLVKLLNNFISCIIKKDKISYSN